MALYCIQLHKRLSLCVFKVEGNNIYLDTGFRCCMSNNAEMIYFFQLYVSIKLVDRIQISRPFFVTTI